MSMLHGGQISFRYIFLSGGGGGGGGAEEERIRLKLVVACFFLHSASITCLLMSSIGLIRLSTDFLDLKHS